MKKRGSIPCLLIGVMLPMLGYLLGLWVGWQQVQRGRELVRVNQALTSSQLPNPPPRRLTKDVRFLLFGDLSRAGKADQQRAIWEQQPDNKVFFGNYINHLLYQHRHQRVDTNTLNRIVDELRVGERLDPDNAFYNYTMAAVYFQCGSELTSAKKGNRETLDIKDESLVRKGLLELEKAGAKPRYQAYVREMVEARIALIPEAHHFEDQLFKLMFIWEQSSSASYSIWRLFRSLVCYNEQGKDAVSPEQRLALSSAWRHYIKVSSRDTWGQIDIQMMFAIVRNSGSHESDLLETLGQTEKAEALRDMCTILNKPGERFRAHRQTAAHKELMKTVNAKGSILCLLALPFVTSLSEEALEPGRRLDYVLFEAIMLSCWLLVLVILMTGVGVIRLLTASLHKPVWLRPSKKWLLFIAGGGVALPAAAYLVSTRWAESAGVNIKTILHWYFLILPLLPLTLTAATSWLMVHFVRRRFKQQKLPLPRKLHWAFAAQFWILLAACWFLALVVNEDLFTRYDGAPFFLVLISIVIFLGLYAIAVITALVRRKSFPLYYGTLSAKLLAVYAVFVLLIAGLFLPVLARRESALLARDTIYGIPATANFTNLESVRMERLRNEFQEAIEKTNL